MDILRIRHESEKRDCVLPASRRVHFGKRYFGGNPKLAESLDLCNVHAWKTKQTYQDYNEVEFPLGYAATLQQQTETGAY